MVTEMTDDCVKLKFVPLMESIRTRFTFGRGRILRTTVKPVLMGLVSSREVDSVMKEPEKISDGSVASVGIGLQSPILADKIQKSDFLKALAVEPPSNGKVRSVDHTSPWIQAMRIFHFEWCPQGSKTSWASLTALAHPQKDYSTYSWIKTR